MKKIGLMAVTAMAAALFVTGCGGEKSSGSAADAKVETTVWKLAFNQPEDHPEFRSIEQFAADLKKATNGAYTIEVYPNELLGSQKETIEMVQSGSLPFSLVAGSLLENWNPDFAVFNLPYVFKDYKHLQRVVKDKAVVGDLFKSLEKQGLTVLCAMYSGTRNVYTKPGVEIRTPADLKGMKIRVMQSDTMVKMLNYMGGTGTPMGQGEVYTAIQTGVLDGAENNEVTYYALKQHEVGPTYNLTGHLMMPDYIVTNTKFYNGLPDDVKKFFADNLDKLVDTEFDMFAAEVSKSLEKAKKGGTVVVEADQEAFKKAVEPLIAEKVTTDSAKKLYEAVQKSRDL